MKNIKDYTLEILFIAFIVLLIGIGFGFLYTASQTFNDNFSDQSYSLIYKQIIYLCIGFFIFLIGITLNHNIYKKLVKPIVFITFILLIITLIPNVSKEIMGARRWITIAGFTFQPSEIAKITIIIYLSSVLSNKEEAINDFYTGILPPLVIISLILTLIFIGNDFSTTFLLVAVTFGMFFLAGVSLLTINMLIVTGASSALLMILMAPYRMRRLFAYLDPWKDPLGAGYQSIQSMKCFSIGKLLGVGIGESTQKIRYLPEAHNDYIFAVIAEEGGVLMAASLVFLYLGIAIVGLNMAKNIRNRYSFLLLSGVILTFFVQAITNIGVVIGLLPATGITLPLISSGGTSLVVFMFMIGVALNISITSKRDIL